MNGIEQPFWVIVNKEIRDHVRSWRFIILLAIITLTCLGALYTSLTSMHEAVKSGDVEDTFFFLKLFTVSDGTLPSFVLFINFLGPLLGIALGFDAMNSELNKGTLCRILSQPIHRDCIINAKFVAALIVITIMLFVLGFLVMGADSHRYSTYTGRICPYHFFFDPKCFLCRSLVEYGDTVLALLPADGYFSFGFSGDMVVFQCVLYDDCQLDC